MYFREWDKSLIWLMGYPFTGVGVTMKIVEYGTNQSMATNYGDHMENYEGDEFIGEYESEPIDSVLFPDGPFWHNKYYNRESKVLLVKTHCGGTCLNEVGVNCTSLEYMDQAIDFREWADACRVGTGFKPDKLLEEEPSDNIETRESNATLDQIHESRGLGLKIRKNKRKGKRWRTPSYPTNKLIKAVVTVRNPFSIIASRFRNHAMNDEVYFDRFFNAKGLQMWCEKNDEQYQDLEEFSKLRQNYSRLLADVPCWIELFRIMKWYANSCRMLSAIDHHVVHFEDYVIHPESTVHKLLQFTGLDFLPGREIRFEHNAPIYKWFNEEKMTAIVRYLNLIMEPKCVEPLFRRYLQTNWVENPFN